MQRWWKTGDVGYVETVKGIREVAQWLRALAVFLEDLGQIPTPTVWLTVICSSSSSESDILLAPKAMHAQYTWAKYSYMEISKQSIFFS